MSLTTNIAGPDVPVLECRGLYKKYGAFTAVNGVDLTVKRGEIFGFLGPNGAGKTTTMKMIAGLIRPTAGNIFVNGVDAVANPIEVKSRIGYIPDRPYIYAKLTGDEFLAFIGSMYRLEADNLKKRITQLLDLFQLTEFRNNLVESYSHGMKQRLTMCAAFLHRPDLIVVDEPMVGLDPKGMRLLKTIFRTSCAEHGSTVFMSTHTLDVVEELCHRVAVIDHGGIVALGALGDLQNQREAPGARLEEIFLRLTGGEELPDVRDAL
ncbi:MAG: Daunorubicin/doxorubicin resistance ATP-binding protein DrrA [Myxococcota bacterium]|nr:Daunorubicin/doxorubicin resistance ATP-binding protein DrrA [Myxococcota bacterium]